MLKKTKIVATLGPASDSQKTIQEMIEAGADVFRFNTKHSDPQWHAERIDRVREVAKKMGISVAILVDLKGPEIRVGQFSGGGMDLEAGEEIYLVSKQQKSLKAKQIEIEELKVVNNLEAGQSVYLDDGFLELRLEKITSQRGERLIKTTVVEGGFLKDKKSINFPGAQIDIPSLIKQDLEFLSMSAKKDVDFVAYSFVRNKTDIEKLREVLKKEGLQTGVISKIESQQAIDNFEEILEASDGIMVARGDLGVELPLEKVPFYQKMMVKRCREEAKPVIVATQMLESMIERPRPTRAEVSDVANAVYDATDAIMLSGETAGGKYPVKSVAVMTQISRFIESKRAISKIEYSGQSLNEVVTYSAYRMMESKFLEDMGIRAFVVFTSTGATPRFLSRFRPKLPIYAVTDQKSTRDQLNLSYGVKAVYRPFPQGHKEMRLTQSALECLRDQQVLKKGDQIVLIYGKHWGQPGESNTIRIEKIQ